MLNGDKTEMLLLGTKQQLAKINLDSFTRDESVIRPASVIKSLGTWLRPQLTMSTHIYLVKYVEQHFTTFTRISKFSQV